MKKIGIIFLIIFVAAFAMNCQNSGSEKPAATIAFENSEYNIDLHTDLYSSALQLNVLFTPEDTEDRSLQFSVDNSDIAEVSNSGKITPKSFGEVVVTAKSATASATCVVNITVEYSKLYSLNYGAEKFIYYGDYPQTKLSTTHPNFSSINNSRTTEKGYTLFSKASSKKYKFEKIGSDIFAVEPLRYDLLSQNGDEYSFISTKVFDARQFHSEHNSEESNDFEKSSLKAWLNDTGTNGYKYKSWIAAGDETKVSLVTAQEISNYSLQFGKYTDYAVARGVSIITPNTPDFNLYSAYSDNANYWLMDKGENFSEVSYVRFDGIIYNYGNIVTQSNLGVRAKVVFTFE